MRWRWFALMLGIVLFSMAWAKGELKVAVIVFVIGAVAGFFLDLIGVGWLHLWKFPRQPFLGGKYFAMVVPGWGVFGMMINLSWDWIEAPPWILFIALVIGLCAFTELLNLKTKSWEYSAPKWLVAVGWLPLIPFFRVPYMMLC